MSKKLNVDELTTDSVPDAPRDVSSPGNDKQGLAQGQDVIKEKPSQAKEKRSKQKEKPSKSKSATSPKTSNSKESPFQSTPGTTNITYNISNANNLHFGHVVTVYPGGNAGSSSSHTPTPPPKKTPKIEELFRSTDVVTEDELSVVSDHVGRDWKLLGKHLEFTVGQLDQLYENHNQSRRDLREVVYQMLLAWKQDKDDKAMVGVLSEHLWSAKQYDAVKFLLKERRN